MSHSPREHLVGRDPFPQSSSNLPQEHVEMVMLALITILDQCESCTQEQIVWIAADPERMLTLHELTGLFAAKLGMSVYQPAPEWAALELAVMDLPERQFMVYKKLMLLGNMLGRVLGYGSNAGSV